MNTASTLKVAIALIGCAILPFGLMAAGHVKIAPTPPKGSDSPVSFPSTISRLSAAVTFPKAAIQAQLNDEKVIPKSFHFDVTDGVRAYGSPERGKVEVTIDADSKRISASTHVSGRVQVEKRIVIDVPIFGRQESRPNVGIDVAGRLTVTASPQISPKWDVDPRIRASAH